MKKLLAFAIFSGLLYTACRKDSDVVTIDRTIIQVQEIFAFHLNGTDFEVQDLRAWQENHDTVVVTQLENIGGESPQILFNIHGTSTGTFSVADLQITLDESLHSPAHYACNGCAMRTDIEYYGQHGDFVLGSFTGDLKGSDGEDYMIQGAFSAIREN